MNQTCNKCHTTKTIENFPKNGRMKTGYSNTCRECVNKRKRELRKNPIRNIKERNACKSYYHKNKEYMINKSNIYYNNNKEHYRNVDLIKKYNITLSDYDKMYSFQNGKCSICSENYPSRGFGSLNVDHNHNETGEVRGLLCHKCNKALGLFNDSIELLKIAENYLENPPARDILSS